MSNDPSSVASRRAELERLQDAGSLISAELAAARAALKRSRSQKNIDRYVAADAACEQSHAACMAAYDAIETAELLEAVSTAVAIRSAEIEASPEFAF